MSALRNLNLMQLCVRQCTAASPVYTSIRQMKIWVRPVMYALRDRREQLEFQSLYPIKPTPRYEFTDWNYNSELYAFARRLGENFDETLLRTAFTDRTFVNQQIKKQEEIGIQLQDTGARDNEYLSIEGLNCIKKTVLTVLREEFPKFPDEGIDAIYELLTSESTLATVSSLIGTKDLILTTDYPPLESTFAKTFHALVGAVERTSGPERARRFVVDLVLTHLVGKDVFELWDIPQPWTMLNSILSQRGEQPPEPRIISQAGKNTVQAVFVIGLYNSDKKLLGKGAGETLEIAQEMAARDTLRDIFGMRKSRNGFQFLANKGLKTISQKAQMKSLN